MKYPLLSLFLFLSINVTGQKRPLELTSNVNWEVWHKEIPVSGEIRTGLVAALDKTVKLNTYFFVQVPAVDASFLCVEISSNDGRYAANLSYDISSLKPGIHQFSWPTKFFKDLKLFSPEELTILSRIGTSCNAKRLTYVLSSWTDLNFEKGILIVLNSERRSRIHIRNKDTNITTKYDCDTIEGQPNVAFNCLCRIPVADICENCEITVVQRVRRGSSISFNKYPMPIKL